MIVVLCCQIMVYAEAEPAPETDGAGAQGAGAFGTSELAGPGREDNESKGAPCANTEPAPTVSPWVGRRVKVNDTGAVGGVAEDFGSLPVVDADLGDGRTVRPRRFAVVPDDGGLVFCDDADITAC